MLDKLVVVFDLDDTLSYEIDYLKSAYKEIAQTIADTQELEVSEQEIYSQMILFYEKGLNAFSSILEIYNLRKIKLSDLIQRYRNHQPNISLANEALELLDFLKDSNIKMGLITDGRSVQQRAKIKALGLENYITDMVISEEFGSEKPSLKNYQFFEEKYATQGTKFFYVGDNIKKDFVTPNKLGWTTICLKDKGYNIHVQNIEVDVVFKPTFEVATLSELKELIANL